MQPIDFEAIFRTVGTRRSEPALDGLATVAAARETLDRLEEMLVARARRRGCSWAEVGAALGVTRRQARGWGATAPPASE